MTQISVRPEDQLPSWIEKSAKGPGAGLETVRSTDIVIPRIILMQALSPPVVDGKYKAGDLVHSISGELIATAGQPVKIIVVKHIVEWIEWNPRSKGGGLKERTTDPHSPLVKRCLDQEKISAPGTPDDGKQAVIEYHSFILIAPEAGGSPLYVSCGKTNYKHGKNLISRMMMRGSGVPCYAGQYTISSGDETNKNNQKYKVFKFNNDGWASEDAYRHAKELHETFKSSPIKIDEEKDDVEVTGAAAEQDF